MFSVKRFTVTKIKQFVTFFMDPNVFVFGTGNYYDTKGTHTND